MTIPATVSPIKCINGDCESEQMTPPGCISENSNVTSTSHSPKSPPSVNCTKQTTIPMLYSLTSQTPSNSFTQQPADIENKAILMEDRNCKNDKVTMVTSPPIKYINNSCTTNGSSCITVNESRKRRIPLDSITNISLSLTPKRKANINCTKQVTLSDAFTQQERK